LAGAGHQALRQSQGIVGLDRAGNLDLELPPALDPHRRLLDHAARVAAEELRAPAVTLGVPRDLGLVRPLAAGSGAGAGGLTIATIPTRQCGPANLVGGG